METTTVLRTDLLKSGAPGTPVPSAPAPNAPVPSAPTTLEETGVSVDQLSQLFVKTLYTGEATGITVADRLRLPYAILMPLVEAIRAEHLIEVKGTAGSGTAGYRYALTDLGRDRARQYFDGNQYVGPAPVPLEQYVSEMKAVAGARGYVDRDRLRAGFAHLIVSDEVLEQVGPAVNAGKGIFLYGPPGNGKTVIAEGMGRALGGDMYVPHAIDVDGQTVTVFDPVNHDSLEGTDIEVRTRQRHQIGATGPPVGPHPPPRRHRRRRADTRDARPGVQPHLEVPRSPDPHESQRRRVPRGRLRTAAHASAGSAEPLDCAAREPRGLPDPSHRPEISDPLRGSARLRDEPGSGLARRRGVHAPDSLQDPDRGSDRRAVHAVFSS